MPDIPRGDIMHLDDFCRLLPNGIRSTRWGAVQFKVWEGDRLSRQRVTMECKGSITRLGWFGAKRRWRVVLHYAQGTSIAGIVQAFTALWGPPLREWTDGWREYYSDKVGVRRWWVTGYEWPRTSVPRGTQG